MNDSTDGTKTCSPRRSSRRERAKRGLGVTTVVTLVFVAQKLTGQIDWSWWWVLSPQWIALGFATLAIVVILLAGVVANLARKLRA